MKTRLFISGLVAAALLVLVLVIRGCINDRKPPESFKEPLATSTTAQVVINDRHVAVRTHKETKATYVPDDGEATIRVFEHGDIDLRVTSSGFTMRPVIGGMISTKLRLAAGAQLFYWNRFEVYGGLGVGFVNSKVSDCVAFGAIGYRLDQLKLRNTSLCIGYNSAQELITLLLWRF
jgi:hypothetical protein